jgi:hypothetical protein
MIKPGDFSTGERSILNLDPSPVGRSLTENGQVGHKTVATLGFSIAIERVDGSHLALSDATSLRRA